jgi:putative LysE/RhtB family amino acid efflux pump
MTALAADFAKGLMLGFSIAAPVGPIALLCIRRTLESGFGAGVAGGLGTALADAAYAGVAAFGITAAATALAAIQLPLQLTGIAVLVWLGTNTFRRRPATETVAVAGGGALGLFAQTFLLTLTNPATILSFAAVFAGFGLVGATDTARAAALVAGTFLGSLLWWIILSGGIAAFRRRVSITALVWINRIAGIFLLGFAAWLAWIFFRLH